MGLYKRENMNSLKKKKIVFYIDALNRGGTEKATLDLINNLNYEKYDVTLIKFFPGGEYNKKVNTEVKNITRYPILNLFKWNSKLEHRVKWWGRNFFDRIPGKIAHKILIGNKYDIEIACGYYFPTKIIENSPKAKKISWVHMDYTIDKSIIGEFTKEEGQKFFGKMDKIVCVSKECEEKFNQKFDMCDKTITRYNIIDVKTIIKKANEKLDVGFDSNCINVVSIGRLTWQKGYDRLLRVHKKLLDIGIRHKLYIIGEGEEKGKLSEYILDNDLKNSVYLLGYKENPYPYIKNADLFVCSSRHESFSLVVAESLVIGTPVISTACTGPKELLNDGEYGVITENNENDLFEGLRRVLIDEEYRKEMSYKSLDRRKFFDTKNAVERWEEILDE